MNIQQTTCPSCRGTGKFVSYPIVSKNEDTGICTAQRKESVCAQCGGKGYVEYVTFSVEEATAILKHCGLSTES